MVIAPLAAYRPVADDYLIPRSTGRPRPLPTSRRARSPVSWSPDTTVANRSLLPAVQLNAQPAASPVSQAQRNLELEMERDFEQDQARQIAQSNSLIMDLAQIDPDAIDPSVGALGLQVDIPDQEDLPNQEEQSRPIQDAQQQHREGQPRNCVEHDLEQLEIGDDEMFSYFEIPELTEQSTGNYQFSEAVPELTPAPGNLSQPQTNELPWAIDPESPEEPQPIVIAPYEPYEVPPEPVNREYDNQFITGSHQSLTTNSCPRESNQGMMTRPYTGYTEWEQYAVSTTMQSCVTTTAAQTGRPHVPTSAQPAQFQNVQPPVLPPTVPPRPEYVTEAYYKYVNSLSRCQITEDSVTEVHGPTSLVHEPNTQVAVTANMSASMTVQGPQNCQISQAGGKRSHRAHSYGQQRHATSDVQQPVCKKAQFDHIERSIDRMTDMQKDQMLRHLVCQLRQRVQGM